MNTDTAVVGYRPVNTLPIHPEVIAGIDVTAVRSIGEYGIIDGEGKFRNLTQYGAARAVFRPITREGDHPDRVRVAAKHEGKTVVGVIDHGMSYLFPGERRLAVLFSDGCSYWATSRELDDFRVL